MPVPFLLTYFTLISALTLKVMLLHKSLAPPGKFLGNNTEKDIHFLQGKGTWYCKILADLAPELFLLPFFHPVHTQF